MADPFIGEIRMFAGNFAPVGWAFCDGSLRQISEDDVLFSLLGTTYGGDGQNTFRLPDLRGRIPIHQGNTFSMGQSAGTETVTLTAGQMPSHTHQIIGNSGSATTTDPTNNFLAAQPDLLEYATQSNDVMKSNALTLTGGQQPHENRIPVLTVSYIIALQGIYPQRN